MAKVRLSIEVSKELAALLDSLAENEETSKTEIVRRALSVMKAYRDQATVGRRHIGFTADPTKLDSELVGVLNLPDTVGVAYNDRANPVRKSA
jgi:metal-responsive CopG/Arc/MetJ family transcriptional regulator